MRIPPLVLLPLAVPVVAAASSSSSRPPNIVIINADDLGYADLSCYGHPTIRTPQLDRMAAEGQRWTSFYAGAAVCTPSRAGLLTGRLPIRSGMASNRHRVLFPGSVGGLPAEELTIAEMLGSAGYATACVGKWHLGHLSPYLPTAQGFDSYYGIPYSNDMDKVSPRPPDLFLNPRSEYFNVPLMRGTEIVERPADQTTITRRYTEESVKFIRESRERPFFLYLAHNLPHIPLFRSPRFEGVSERGLYGDVVEEIDWSVGEVLRTLRELQLAEKTLVVFTSDNGPWLTHGEQGGSAGLLRDGKGSTWEGGSREPFIAWWPGTIRPATITGIGCQTDLFVTACKLAGVEPPTDRVLDSIDLSATFRTGAPSPRETMMFYRDEEIYAVRQGPWKAHFTTQGGYEKEAKHHSPALLFNVNEDPGESYDLSAAHPEIVAELTRVAEAHRRTVTPVENQLDKR